MNPIESRDIKELDPIVKTLALAFITRCKNQKIDVIITSTYRSIEAQNRLYAKGRTTPGPKVTNAKGGQSFHNHRVAFDFCPIVDGKCAWEDTKLFTQCGKIAETCGLEWAGRWRKFKELAHCQYTQGLTTADFMGGKRLKPKDAPYV